MNITVYLGANNGNERMRQAAEQLGTWIGQNGNQLVYGGSKSGLMGILAEAALRAGGKVIGVEPKAFVDKLRKSCRRKHLDSWMVPAFFSIWKAIITVFGISWKR